MKQVTNNIALSLTGIMVKTYMAVGILWSKADAEYHKLKAVSKAIPAVKSQRSSQPAF